MATIYAQPQPGATILGHKRDLWPMRRRRILDVRDRDTMEQERIPIVSLAEYLLEKLSQ